MKRPDNEMILASAGSGKTFTLTDRYVKLLLMGAEPGRIVALTFTRKAAGEFFDEILKKLARASTDEASARQLAERTGDPKTSPARFRELLRSVIEAMPHLTLTTFDAFFARIVRSFPLELGLSGDFEVLQDYSMQMERRRVLRSMFARTGAEPNAAQSEFMEAFKRATFGLEEKRLSTRLDRFLDSHQEIQLAAPSKDLWGDPSRIWPSGCEWLQTADAAKSARSLQIQIDARNDLSDKQRIRWDDFFGALATWTPGAPLPKPVEYLLKNALAAWDAIVDGSAEITIERKKFALRNEECAALAGLCRAIVGAEFSRNLVMTRGIFSVLDGYERVYHEMVRRAGRLTFADVQRLLAPDSGAPVLTREPGDDLSQRLLIDWRLDGHFDHWLLDEFQDTSHAQWRVLQNLIDEVVQDTSGERSFFYVGDVKQAIYAWREGDARLFREVFDHYNRGVPGVLNERRLDVSWRSGAPILAMVNAVFGNAAVMRDLFPAAAAGRWSAEWGDHKTALPKLAGHAAWLQADDEDARFRLTLDLLNEIKPLDRGMTVAVLVQTNSTATQMADYLRREGGLPAVAESDLHINTDNPLSSAILALFKAAAHPGDTLAREHVFMTPLLRVLIANGWNRPDALTAGLLARVHEDGFERTIENLVLKLEPHLKPDDEFSRERARQMTEAARLFDESGTRDVAEFIQFMERHVVRDAETAAVVRVMTIHKSKGLGFDIVFLPDLQGEKLASRRDGLAVKKSENREVEWVYSLPNNLFSAHDPVLRDYIHSAEADACYDKLALLYVAMTRAKRGMYVITEPVGKSKSHNFPRLITDTLGDTTDPITIGNVESPCGFTSGDPQWFKQVKEESKPGHNRRVVSPVDISVAKPVIRRSVKTPSKLKTGSLPGRVLFTTHESDGAQFGSMVHAALAAVEWWDKNRIEPWRQEMQKRGISDETIFAAEACLNSPSISHVFRKPENVVAEIWRERNFEIVLGEEWITGIFDRVLVERAGDGSANRATVFDFKTDFIPQGSGGLDQVAESYRGQMELYRKAAAILCGIDPSSVSCALVFTRAANGNGEVKIV